MRNLYLTTGFLLSFTLALGVAYSAEPATSSKEAGPIKFGPKDWPWWRGQTVNGFAAAGEKPPTKWSKTENVVWKVKTPGRGHASPTVVGDRVYLPTADEGAETRSVLCFDRATGEKIWERELHRGGMEKKGNKKSSQASSSIACDGERLFVNFLHEGSMVTSALGLDGKILWQKKVIEFATHQGFGSSPALYRHLLYVTADSKHGGLIAALDRSTGEIVWKDGRPKQPNYASAVVLKVAGREQVLISGCDLVAGYEPLTGRKLWEVEGSTTECVTTMVTDGERVFVSGGYPKNHVQAIAADGSGKTAWENTARVYVPSMLVRDGSLFAVQDGGVAMCWKSGTGEKLWEQRLGGTFSASLILVGDAIWATNEAGQTFIYEATPQGYRAIAENKLGDEVFATPVVCGNRIYHRVAELADGKRQEYLYCLGTK